MEDLWGSYSIVVWKRWRICGEHVEELRERDGSIVGKQWNRCGEQWKCSKEAVEELWGVLWRSCAAAMEV